MPLHDYLEFTINDKPVDVGEIKDLPISMDYDLEDERNFREKGSSQVLDIDLPATVNNNRLFNNFYNPNVEQENNNTNLYDCLIKNNGVELLKGKSFLVNSVKLNGNPSSYKINCYGNNGDWIIGLKDKTLHDFVSPHTHVYNSVDIFGSLYNFDGFDEELDYFYAPVRYVTPFGGFTGTANDKNIDLLDLRPSISIYWILYRAFQSLGYKIRSVFFNTDYFRGFVMPWVWGDFHTMGTAVLDSLKFKATGKVYPVDDPDNGGESYTSFFIGGNVTADYQIGSGALGLPQDTFELENDAPPLGFDNNNNYSASGGTMHYVFNHDPADVIGISDIVFNLIIPIRFYTTTFGGKPPTVRLVLDWTIYGGPGGSIVLYEQVEAGNDSIVPVDVDFTVPSVSPGDQIDMQLHVHYIGNNYSNNADIQLYSRKIVSMGISGDVLEEAFLSTKSFKKTIGSVVDFKLYDGFKNYKILDLIAGLIDTFDLEFLTDNINKVVYVEPIFPYENEDGVIHSYFTNYRYKIDWTTKIDYSKPFTLELFNDLSRYLTFAYKEDSGDGGANKYSKRYGIKPAMAKFKMNNRFKENDSSDSPTNENRFFAPTMNIQMQAWEEYQENLYPTPQIVALIPENVANTSADESKFIFQPRICFARKVDLHGEGDIFSKNGKIMIENAIYACPQMFSVNYNPGGETDPCLSYNDQLINGEINHGLLRRFFLPRLAMMNNGKRLKCNVHLNNADVRSLDTYKTGISIEEGLYWLFNISGYKPLLEQSTGCTLWKYSPITETDSNSVYPSLQSTGGEELVDGDDIKYNELLLLPSDIPQNHG